MAEFSHVGKHCTLSSCGRHEFLPFFCNRCGGTFCNEHYKYDDHGCLEKGRCNIVAIVCPVCSKTMRMPSTEDPNAVWHEHATHDCEPTASRKQKSSQICAAPRCRQKLGPTTTHICKRCHKTTCLTHRFPDTHDCWRSGSWGDGPQDRHPRNSPPTYNAAKKRMEQSSQLHNVNDSHQFPAPHHPRRSAKPITEKHLCPFCNTSFSDTETLVSHVTLLHSESDVQRGSATSTRDSSRCCLS